ncbi:MAG: hypothetical protein PUB13_08530 [Lachnospiraceae bacterium]|nr:hypothetical protein [Lachnospiraceae bacterium]
MEVIGFIVIAAIIILLIFGNGYVNEKRLYRQYQKRLITDYGKPSNRVYKDGEFEHIDGYFKNHQTDFSLDEITWNDLNMDDLFKQINYAKSSAGEEYLYYLLRNPSTNEKDWEDFEKKTEYFMTHEEDRMKLQLALHDMGYTGKYSVYDYLNNLDILKERNSKKDIFIDLLFIPAILLLWVNIGFGIAAIFALILINLISYFKEKEIIDPYITCFAYVFRILNEVDIISRENIPCIEDDIKLLKEQKRKFTRFKRFSFLIMSKSRMTGNPTEILVDYIRMFFHLDIIKFNSMLEEVKKHWENIDKMITIIGRLDAYLAVGEYRTYLEDYAVPVYKKNAYQAKNCYHPLLKDPVKNDIQLEKSILITGSNASGKSTMLKTVAVNAILAQSIHTVAADFYEADCFKIYTSLTLKDNIFAGDSFYMAEIKSIRRMIEAAKETQVPILCFVDEVLRGTNTIERIAASSIILQKLSSNYGYCLAATHDIELTEILKNHYENMHFEEIMTQGDISFPYRLCRGKATSRNAIRLLEIMGYGDGITKTAEKMAQHFEKDGVWEVLT